MRIDDMEQDAAQHEGLRHQEDGDEDQHERAEDSDDSDDAEDAEERAALSASTGAELSQHVGEGVGWVEDDDAPQQLSASGGVLQQWRLMLTVMHKMFHVLKSSDKL